MLSEALHEKKIAMIAEQIQSAKKRIYFVLLVHPHQERPHLRNVYVYN